MKCLLILEDSFPKLLPHSVLVFALVACFTTLLVEVFLATFKITTCTFEVQQSSCSFRFINFCELRRGLCSSHSKGNRYFPFNMLGWIQSSFLPTLDNLQFYTGKLTRKTYFSRYLNWIFFHSTLLKGRPDDILDPLSVVISITLALLLQASATNFHSLIYIITPKHM